MSNMLTADSMRAAIELEDDLNEAISRLPCAEDLDEYTEAMRTVIRLERDFHDAIGRLPSIDELRERIAAMQIIIPLADE